MISIQKIKPEQVWPIRQKAMYPDKALQDMILPEDKDGEHFGIFEEEQLVSIISLFLNGETAQFRKLATIEEKQRLGYGRLLLDHVISHSMASGAENIWCNARKNKVSFYLKAGFHETDQTFFLDGYDFVIMKLDF
jgi:ribosomal protein S18 acetylase RimI-like enzyme